MRCNSHAIKLTHLKYTVTFFSIFTQMCNHCYNQFVAFPSFQKETVPNQQSLPILLQILPSPPPPTTDNQTSISCLYRFVYSGSCILIESYRMCDFVTQFIQNNVFNFHPCCSMYHHLLHSFLLLSNIPLHAYTLFYLSIHQLRDFQVVSNFCPL